MAKILVVIKKYSYLWKFLVAAKPVHRWFSTFPMSGLDRLSTLRPHEIFLKM